MGWTFPAAWRLTTEKVFRKENMSDVEEPTGEEPPAQEPTEEPTQVSDVPTVVVGKKRASRAKQVTVAPEAEPVEEPVPEVKPKAKASRRQVSSLTQVQAPAPTAEVTEPTPPPKKPRQKKTKPEAEDVPTPSKAEWQQTRLLSDMNDFTSRIQELHKLNELHRKNMFRELLGGMV